VFLPREFATGEKRLEAGLVDGSGIHHMLDGQSQLCQICRVIALQR